MAFLHKAIPEHTKSILDIFFVICLACGMTTCGAPHFKSLRHGILFLFLFISAITLPAHGELESCSDIDTSLIPVSGFILGCSIDQPASKGEDERGQRQSRNDLVQELISNFDDYTDAEKLLLRSEFIVPGQKFPSVQEVQEILSAPNQEIGIPHALILDSYIDISLNWLPYIIEIISDENIDPEVEFILAATVISTTGWVGRDGNGTNFNALETRVNFSEKFSELEYSTIPWAAAKLGEYYATGDQVPVSLTSAHDRLREQMAVSPVGIAPFDIPGLDEELRNFSARNWLDLEEWLGTGNIRALRLGTLVAEEGFWNRISSRDSFGILLDRQSRYGEPMANFHHAESINYGLHEFRFDEEQANRLYLDAASHSLTYGVDKMILQLIADRKYQEAFRLALFNSGDGWVRYDSHGYQLADMLAGLVFSGTEAEVWRDFLSESCRSQTMLWEEVSQCPPPITASKYKPLEGWRLALAETSDIQRSLGGYELDTGSYKALLIANSDYGQWSSLTTPSNDIRTLATVLQSQYGFEVVTLENAGRADTLRAIYDLGRTTSFNDHVLIYYAGHGVIDRLSDVAYWIPVDGSRDFAPDWISADEVTNAFRTIPAKHLLMVADSCYSGKLLRGDAPTITAPSESVVKRLIQKKARVALTSGGEEPVVDSIQGSEHSIFAAALLDTLRANAEPLPASTLYEGVLDRVSREASQTPQYSDIRELGHDGGDFIFVPAGWN